MVPRKVSQAFHKMLLISSWFTVSITGRGSPFCNKWLGVATLFYLLFLDLVRFGMMNWRKTE
jgi:hypothetical protein